MPFINERLEANRDSIAKNRAESGPVRVSRFRFEPEVVMARLRDTALRRHFDPEFLNRIQRRVERQRCGREPIRRMT